MVADEFAAAKEHYRKLGVADRIEFDLREGGRETQLDCKERGSGA
jgi:hypothetical protein